MKNKKIRFVTLFISIIFVLLISCEGPQYFSLKVVDKTTQQPIDSVFVNVRMFLGKTERPPYNLQGYTDSAGMFLADEMIGTGLIVKKISFQIEFSKIGYNSKTEINKTDGIVELEKMK